MLHDAANNLDLTTASFSPATSKAFANHACVLTAHSATAWFLEGTQFVKSESPAASVTSYVFRGADIRQSAPERIALVQDRGVLIAYE